ncbi:hypothetical protein D3C76_1715050 [compost metagenome]
MLDELELAWDQAIVIDTDQRGAQSLVQILFDLLIGGIEQQRVVPQLKDLEGNGRRRLRLR